MDELPESTPAPSNSVPPQAAPHRLPRAAWIVLIALLLWLAISMWTITFVERIEYAIVRGRERAEVESGRELLGTHSLADLERAFGAVAKVIGPSVVHIDTKSVIDRRTGDESAALFGLPDHYEAEGQGSGVIIDKTGYILTNNHVIDGATAIEVHLSDERAVEARVIGADPLTDLAVLKIDADNLTAAEWGDSDALKVGSLVWAVGNPFGLDRSITFGIISAKNRRGVSASPYQEFLQTDAAVNPGNSGGPLVNVDGKVVGINTAIIGRAFQGIGFAIPSSTARDVYERLKATGKVARGWLGVALADLTPELAEKLELKGRKGALVKEVMPRSPAALAGIKVGDVVIAWNGQPIDRPTTLSLLVAKTEVGAKAKAQIIRDGKEMTLEVHVQERPARVR